MKTIILTQFQTCPKSRKYSKFHGYQTQIVAYNGSPKEKLEDGWQTWHNKIHHKAPVSPELSQHYIYNIKIVSKTYEWLKQNWWMTVCLRCLKPKTNKYKHVFDMWHNIFEWVYQYSQSLTFKSLLSTSFNLILTFMLIITITCIKRTPTVIQEI